MFEALRKAYLEDQKKQIENNAFYILHGFCESWSADYQKESDKGIRAYSTDTRWNQYQAGTITREKAVELATIRMEKQIEKKTEKKLAYIELVENAPDLKFISINVEYKRSSVWGYNPHVEVVTNEGRFFGYASGCGYDKESAAVADAFNKSLSIMKVLFSIKEEGLKAGKTSASKTACTGHDNSNICGYGAGYSVLPYFEGGVGVSCFWKILKKAGLETSASYGKRENHYFVEKAAPVVEKVNPVVEIMTTAAESIKKAILPAAATL